jgi:hypothetical protein
VRLLAVAIVLAALSAGSAAALTVRPHQPRCFGAASRDPRKACHNPRLRYMVRPRPSIAQITPNAPCDRLQRKGPVHPCAFGVDAGRAVTTVALIGDSHASHWRAALQVAAVARRWRGISMTNGICPISKAIKRLPTRARRRCVAWNRGIVKWLTKHPAVTVVVQAQINSPTSVSAVPARSQFNAKVSGYRRVWHAFPRTVRHIVAIRDNPRVTFETPGCVMRARADRTRPDVACALPRAWGLRPDPLAAAARSSHPSRVDLVDMTHFFCGPTLCYPVVGGALVHKDQHHLTRVFAMTLGPFLLRRLNRLVARD